MQPTRHVAIIVTIIIAALATIHLTDTFAAGRSAGLQDEQTRREVRIGTVDIYLIAEQIMLQPTLLRARQQAEERYQGRLDQIEEQLRDIEARLQVARQSDPQVQRLLERAQSLQEEYQQILQERQIELEAINSRQLIEAFGQIRSAAQRVADERGYTHIISNRSFDRPIQTETVGATLQEMLARPVIVGIEEDDLTEIVLESLDLDPPEEGEEGGIMAPANMGPER